MKLLLDENLSRRLVPFLQHDFPGSSQVVLEGLEAASDRQVWEHARQHGFVIVTRDADFEELSLGWGTPPQVVWLKTRDQTRAATLKVLLESRSVIQAALQDPVQACIEIFNAN